MENDKVFSLISKLSESTGFKFLKSSRSIKKTVGQFVFEVIFFSSKCNDEENAEINADFRVSYKKYGRPSTAQSSIAGISFRPDNGYWYDISTEDKFYNILNFFDKQLQLTAVDLVSRFETDFKSACQFLLDEKFYEYKVELDFLEEILGEDKIKYRVDELIEKLNDNDYQQINEYRNGARNKMWMLNRCNLKFIVDKNYV